jgi:hypothetical protein
MKVARSSLECYLYIELHPCECGGRVTDLDHRMVLRSETLCASYEGRCVSCGSRVDYLFALDDEIPPASSFGGARPSTIVDAGQYLAAADMATKQVTVSERQPEQRRHGLVLMARAVACLEEILKWIPEGGDRIPQEAFFTTEGTQIYAREPERFRRARLELVLDVYRETLLRLSSGV